MMIQIVQSTDEERAAIRRGDGDLSYDLKDENGKIAAAINARMFGDTLEIEDFVYDDIASGALVFDVVMHYAMEKGMVRMVINEYDEEKIGFLNRYDFEEVYREGTLCHMKKKLISVHEYVREYVMKLDRH